MPSGKIIIFPGVVVFLRPRDLREEDECDHENEAKNDDDDKKGERVDHKSSSFSSFQSVRCVLSPRVEEKCEESTLGKVLLQKNMYES